MAEVRFGFILCAMARWRQKTLTFACAAIAAFTLAIPAGFALAQGSSDPTTEQYADALTDAANSAGADEPASSPASGSGGSGGGGGGVGALPFTGTDLVGLAAIATCMLATGFMLSRLAKRRQ
jgi:uncharacterized membrane protein YeiB